MTQNTKEGDSTTATATATATGSATPPVSGGSQPRRSLGVPGGIFQKLKAVLGLDNHNASLRESLQDVIDEHQHTDTAGHMTEQEQAMLLNILSFGGLRVESVMVPRADIVAVEQEDSLEEVLRTLADAGHSRVPVYRESLDDPVGMFHIKDLLPIALKQLSGEKPVDTWLSRERRPVLFVPPSMAVLDLFLKMQATRIHMALVIDEYGGTDGLVTIEDLVEEIVGEIEDEHDTEEGPLLTEVSKGHYLADARVSIEDVTQTLGKALMLEDIDEDTDTLGGLVFDMIGRVPHRGELIEHPAGFEFEIADADARRIKKIRIKTITSRKAPALETPAHRTPVGNPVSDEGSVKPEPESKSIREA